MLGRPSWPALGASIRHARSGCRAVGIPRIRADDAGPAVEVAQHCQLRLHDVLAVAERTARAGELWKRLRWPSSVRRRAGGTHVATRGRQFDTRYAPFRWAAVLRRPGSKRGAQWLAALLQHLQELHAKRDQLARQGRLDVAHLLSRQRPWQLARRRPRRRQRRRRRDAVASCYFTGAGEYARKVGKNGRPADLGRRA